VGQLVADATQEVSELVRHELALAKAELQNDAKQAGFGAGMLGAAGLFAAVAFVLLCVAAAFGLHEGAGWPRWLSFLVIGALLVVLAAVLGLLGKGRLSRIKPPERAIASSKKTVDALKGRR
jgi:uncharacterized membrane protein YqjE